MVAAGPQERIGAIPLFNSVVSRRIFRMEKGDPSMSWRSDLLSKSVLVAFCSLLGLTMVQAEEPLIIGEHLTDVLVRVPLLFRIPGYPPQRRDDVVSLVDLYGTLVRLLTGSPADANPHGRDLSPRLTQRGRAFSPMLRPAWGGGARAA